jgi:plasmid stability protein
MGTLTIRNVPDEIIEGVRTSAELHQRSMEQEVRELLQRRYGPRSEVLRRIRARWEALPETDASEVEQWRETGRR